jgi:shikimate dehydrogenase
VATLLTFYNYFQLDEGNYMTRYVGLIGRGLKHSISPLFQQAAFDQLDLDVRYEVWETEQGGLSSVVEGLREPSKLGANVTIPYKEYVLPLLDEIHRDAQRIGAVNTIVNKGGRLMGYNTDAAGFLRALYENGRFDPQGKRVVILGAGGAARAVSFALVDTGVRSLKVINRTPERGEALASALGPSGVEVVALSCDEDQAKRALSTCDLVVNCTSVGMKDSDTEGQSPLTAEQIPGGALVYDLVYNPVETGLLMEAAKAGARVLGGLSMLVYQGAAAFELWMSKPAPVDIMLTAARRAMGE